MIQAATTSVSEDYISSIRNLVCPECGGRMGGCSQPFRCQGQCGRDWRSVWESALGALNQTRTIKVGHNPEGSTPGESSLRERSRQELRLPANGPARKFRWQGGGPASKEVGVSSDGQVHG